MSIRRIPVAIDKEISVEHIAAVCVDGRDDSPVSGFWFIFCTIPSWRLTPLDSDRARKYFAYRLASKW